VISKHAAFPREIGQKGKSKKKVVLLWWQIFAILHPPPPRKTISEIFLISENKFLFSANKIFSKIYINFCDIIIIVVVSLGGKN